MEKDPLYLYIITIAQKETKSKKSVLQGGTLSKARNQFFFRKDSKESLVLWISKVQKHYHRINFAPFETKIRAKKF